MGEAELQIKKMIEGIGAIAELAGVFLKELLRNGFTREEAVTIISDFITTTMVAGAGHKEDNNE